MTLAQQMKGAVMAEPASSSAGIGIFGKLAVLFLIFCGPLVAFALGTQVVPLDPRDPTRDAVRRVMGCFISSAVFTLACLLVLHRYLPWVIPGSGELAEMMEAPRWVGVAFLCWVLCVLGALPGWWIVGPFMRWFAARRDKDFGAIVQDGKELLKP